MKNTLVCIAAVLLICGMTCGGKIESRKTGISTIFLVRHAEKAAEPAKDPPLTEEGETRAEELAYLLHHVDIQAVYSTPYVRTKQTALPTAEDHGLKVRSYQPREEGFLDRILETHAEEAVLIVGHSNTIPGLANELAGGFHFADLADETYDNLFVASLSNGMAVSVLRIRFGEPTPEK